MDQTDKPAAIDETVAMLGEHPSPVTLTVTNGSSPETVINVELSGAVTNVNAAKGTSKPSSEKRVRLRAIIRTFPFFIVGICLIQILTFCLGGPELRAYLGYDPHRRHEVWRFLTVMLVHSDVDQLCDNLIVQLALGVLLEIIHHWRRTGMIYLGGVLGGSLFSAAFQPNIHAVGSSAASYALLLAHLGNVMLNLQEMIDKFPVIFRFLAVVFFLVRDSLYEGLILKEGSKNISPAGHIGGMVTGFLISILVLKTFLNRQYPGQKTIRRICVEILVILSIVLVFVVINIGPPSLYCESDIQIQNDG